MKQAILIPFLVTVSIIVIFIFVSRTLSSVVLFIPAVIVAYIIYIRIFYKKQIASEKLLPLYLLALSIQFLHFAEEYMTDFVSRLPGLLGQEAYPLDYWLVFNMAAYSVFLLGGIVLFKRIQELMVIPIFFVVTGVFLNSIGHILLAIYTGGYFPGLYTAIIYLFMIPIFIKKISICNTT